MSGPRHADRPSHTEGSMLNPDTLEIAPGRSRETIEGWIPQLASEEELRVALEKAFDYRGDVTLTTKDSNKRATSSIESPDLRSLLLLSALCQRNPINV